jgi:MFS family permease
VAALAGTNLFAHIIDRASLNANRTRVHRSFVAVCALGPLFLLGSCLTSHRLLVVLLLSLAAFFVTAATPVYSSNSLYVAPKYAGTLASMQNCFANFAGILAPIVTGYAARSFGWTVVFVVVAIVTLIGLAAFRTFGTTELLFE